MKTHPIRVKYDGKIWVVRFFTLRDFELLKRKYPQSEISITYGNEQKTVAISELELAD